MMNEVVIVSAVRTPLGCFMGTLSHLSAVDLGIQAVEGALRKINLDKSLIDELIIGHVLQAGCGQAPARQIAVGAGLKSQTPCFSVNKVCSSGLKAVDLAFQSIALGKNEIVIAGGVESMSNSPHYLNLRKATKFGNSSSIDGMMNDGLTDVYSKSSMGILADNCASDYSISRESQDEYAINSYVKSIKSTENNYFSDEIIPVLYKDKRGNEIVIEKDEQISKVKFDKIPKLSPAFVKNGSVTAANSSPISDGASILVLMSSKKAKEMERTSPSTRSPRDGTTTEEHHRSFPKSPSFLRMKNDDDLGFISPAVKVLLIIRSSHHRGGTKDMNLLSRIPVLFTDISLCSFRININAERGERLPL